MCNHEKIYDEHFLFSNPPQCKWYCKLCGQTGYDIIGIDIAKNTNENSNISYVVTIPDL